MKRVIFVATVADHINAFHIPYLQYFKENGYEVHVACNGEPNMEYCDKHFNLNFARFPLKLQNIKVYKELKKIINENKYDIIHCHTPVGGVLTRLAARKSRKKNNTRVIYTAHGFHFYKGAPKLNWLIYYPIEKLMARYTDCLITMNKEDYNLAKKKFNIKDIRYVHGVGCQTKRLDVEISEDEKVKYKEELNIFDDTTVLSYIGELSKRKNQILLINVVESLVKKNVKVCLLLVGKGSLMEKYRAIIEKKGLSNHIKLLGRIDNISSVLSITDIYVSSSKQEGLPVNIMEAMYMKLPIVATDVRGHNDLINNGENGYLINIRNEKDFGDTIVNLIYDEQKRKNFGIISNTLSYHYLLDNVKKEMVDIYEESNRKEFQ